MTKKVLEDRMNQRIADLLQEKRQLLVAVKVYRERFWEDAAMMVTCPRECQPNHKQGKPDTQAAKGMIDG